MHRLNRGFTLIEMMVAVALFSIVMLVTTSSLLALVAANQKAQAIHSVMENLNIAVDGMVRAARMGTSFHCGTAGSYSDPLDCSSGGTLFAFKPYDGTTPQLYWFQNGRLYESTTGSTSGGIPVTSEEVEITNMTFYVSGSTVQDQIQPKMIVVIQGTVTTGKTATKSSFTIQATASQRALDL